MRTRHIIIPARRGLQLLSVIFALIISGGLLNMSCTHNNGDIGRWFGTWQVMDIATDGTPDPEYDANCFWEFQNDIIKVVMVGPDGYDRDIYYCIGTWQETSDNTLTFNFTHSDDSGDLLYKPFGIMHFPSDAPFTLTITEDKGKQMTLKYVDQNTSTEYSYQLQKR